MRRLSHELLAVQFFEPVLILYEVRYLLVQVIYVHRFADKDIGLAFKRFYSRFMVFTESGKGDDRNMGSLDIGTDTTADFESVYLRHRKVSYDQLRHDLFHLGKSVPSVDCRIDIVIRREPLLQIVAQLGIVFHDQNVISLPFLPARGLLIRVEVGNHVVNLRRSIIIGLSFPGRIPGCHILARNERKQHDKRYRGISRTDRDAALHIFHKFLHYRQAQTCMGAESCLHRTMVVERFEKSADLIFRNAFPAVGDHERQPFSIGRCARIRNFLLCGTAHPDAHISVLRRVFDGVREQIGKHFLDYVIVEPGVETFHLRDEFGLYMMFAGIELEKRENIFHELDDVSRLAVQRHLQGLYLPEFQQPADHVLDTDHILAYEFHIAPVRRIHRNQAVQLLQRVDDKSQRSLQIVGDAGKEIDSRLCQFIEVLLPLLFQFQLLLQHLSPGHVRPHIICGQDDEQKINGIRKR